MHIATTTRRIAGAGIRLSERETLKKKCGVGRDSGGGGGIRTPDLYSAIVALSQLSYAPLSQPAKYTEFRPAQSKRPGIATWEGVYCAEQLRG